MSSDRSSAPLWLFGATLMLAGLAVALMLIGRTDPAPDAAPPIQAEADKVPQAQESVAAWDSVGADENRTVQVRRGKMVELLRSPGGKKVATVGAKTIFGSPTVFWVAERRGRWLGVPTDERLDGELGWLRLDADRLRFGATPYLLRVSLDRQRVDLRRDGSLIHRAAITIGGAGTDTPAGRFAVTDTIRKGLLPVYGCCAIALTARQANLPPGWPGGDRIALHGWSGPVGGAASNGCLRASNPDMEALMRHVTPGVPVLIDA